MALPVEARDTFTGGANADLWSLVLGGEVEEECGPVASGEAMHFNKVRLNTYKVMK